MTINETNLSFSHPTVQLIYFSPTGSTKKNCDALIKGLGIKIGSEINLTHKKQREQESYELNENLILIGIPVYSGTIPSLLLLLLQKMKGNGKWAILLITYGNVKTGTCLENLVKIFRSNGFQILAAVKSLGQHSFCCDQIHLAKSRPDSRDLLKMEEFGKRIREKYDKFPNTIPLEAIELPSPKPKPTLASIPKLKAEFCKKCMKCVDICPIGAIDSKDLTIAENLCIFCFACVRICEYHARKIEFIAPPEKLENFYAYTKQRNDPELII